MRSVPLDDDDNSDLCLENQNYFGTFLNVKWPCSTGFNLIMRDPNIFNIPWFCHGLTLS